MKFSQLERALIVSGAAVFFLAAAHALEMTRVCPAGESGSCSDRPATEERTISPTPETSAWRRPSDNLPGLPGRCYPGNYAWDEQSDSLPASVPTAPASCPVAADGYVAKMTARLNVPAEHEANDSER